MKWEQLEEWLYETRTLGGTFTQADVAEHFGVEGRAATAFIRSYLDAQRARGPRRPRTLYVIYRDGRTTAATWHVGVRTADARADSYQFFADVQHRFKIALSPDLLRIGELNPRARRKCDAIIDAVGEGAMRLLQVAVDGLGDDENGDGVKA
jgi:hypothetical protein